MARRTVSWPTRVTARSFSPLPVVQVVNHQRRRGGSSVSLLGEVRTATGVPLVRTAEACGVPGGGGCAAGGDGRTTTVCIPRISSWRGREGSRGRGTPSKGGRGRSRLIELSSNYCDRWIYAPKGVVFRIYCSSGWLRVGFVKHILLLVCLVELVLISNKYGSLLYLRPNPCKVASTIEIGTRAWVEREGLARRLSKKNSSC